MNFLREDFFLSPIKVILDFYASNIIDAGPPNPLKVL
jgi:hypothetical protein